MDIEWRFKGGCGKWSAWEDAGPVVDDPLACGVRSEIATLLADFHGGAKVTITTSSGHKGQWRIKSDG